MPTHCDRIAEVVFSGITFDDTIGFGSDVNQAYSMRVSPHHTGGCLYQSSMLINGVYVYVVIIIAGGETSVAYDLTPQVDLDNTVHVFSANLPSANTVFPNMLSGGGIATVTLTR